MKTLDKTNKTVVDDAVRLLKSDFVSLYEKLGYNKVLLGVSWHSIRTSKQGQDLIGQYQKKGLNPLKQPLTFISNVEEEAEERGKSQKKVKLVKEEPSLSVNEEVTDKTIKVSECDGWVGKKVNFSKRGSEVLLTGTVSSLVTGTDGKRYAKISVDGKICMKQVTGLTVVS